jgi:hypothetical protein
MSLRLPALTDKRCLLLAFCGSVVSEGNNPIEELSREKQMTARYTKAGRTVFFRLWVGAEHPRNHVDVAIAPRELFGRGQAPKVTHKIEEIQAAVAFLAGRPIQVDARGWFQVPQEELPSLIQSTLIQTEADEVQIRMSGGTLSVRGAPIHTIAWFIPSEGQPAQVTLEARTTMDFTESYLEDGLALIESAFNAFILRSPRHE